MREGLIKPAAAERARAVAIAEKSTRTALLQAAAFASAGAVLMIFLAFGRM